MKAFRLLRWSGGLHPPRARPCRVQNPLITSLRLQSTAASLIQPQVTSNNTSTQPSPLTETPFLDLRTLPSPPPSLAASSAKLNALHARLSLPLRFPLEILARCLIDSSADPNPAFNNTSLAILGADLFGLYTSEAILCRYPRLPSEVVFAAMWAYCGPKTLAAVTREWGVEVAAEPGGEVDPGYLQCKRRIAGNAEAEDALGMYVKEMEKVKGAGTRRRTIARGESILHEDFGTASSPTPRHTTLDLAERPELREETEAQKGVTLETASAQFVRALMGAVYLQAGKRASKIFFKEHILSRHLEIHKMFEFKQPTRDLSRLCAREGFESPVARILSETGRKSRTPVFIVGVFSGNEKLGEGAGASLDEARIRASIAALKGWYLYSPLEVRMPSDVDGANAKNWKPVLIDGGEVIV